MPRVLLLFPTTTYRAEAFLGAAGRLGLQVTVGSEEESSLADLNPAGLLRLGFDDPEAAARTAVEFARTTPIDAVIPVDEQTAVVAATIAAALSLRHNSVQAAMAAANKHRTRESLRRNGVPVPWYRLCSLDDDPRLLASKVKFPCVMKPLMLSGSRGVIRADTETEFASAFQRLCAILLEPNVPSVDRVAGRQILVEAFMPGAEVALEGLLSQGELQVLALFDKPDPLDGPFFEETIYVTPSTLPSRVQEQIVARTAQAIRALGLTEGPVHAELKVNDTGPWVVEVAARSIGGRCSRVLCFGDEGLSLEEVILRHALGMEIGSLQREAWAAGVMMIPIPRAGILREVRGLAEAKSSAGIEEISITAHVGQQLIPLPEGSRYLGFIFARGTSPKDVEAFLREAHGRLQFTVE